MTDKPKTPFQQRIASIGEEKAAEQLGVKVRTVRSWRQGARRPRLAQAHEIIARWPVTLEDIYAALPADDAQSAEYDGPERRKQAA